MPDAVAAILEARQLAQGRGDVGVEHIMVLGGGLQVFGEEHQVAAGPQQGQGPGEDPAQLGQELPVAQVAQVGGRLGEGRGGALAALLALAGLLAGHHRRVGRVGEDEVEGALDHCGEAAEGAGVAHHIGLWGQAQALADGPVDLGVAGREVDPDGAAALERAGQQGAAHAGEGVEHVPVAAGEKAHQLGDELGRLGRGVGPPQVVGEGVGAAGRVACADHRAQGIGPLAATQLVEPVARVDLVAHRPGRAASIRAVNSWNR